MTGEVEFSSLNKDDGAKVKLEQPDRVPRRPSDEEVAKYRKTRLVLVVLFGIIVLAMVVAAVIIIVVSPKCAPKEEKTDEGNGTKTDELEDWLQGEIVYQVYIRSFKDSGNDGDGDLKGILEKIDYFKDIGVKVVRLSPIYKRSDFKAVDDMFGNMDDFKALLEKAHEMGMKIVLDFVPNYTSDEHPWFLESNNSASAKRDWYIWRKEDTNNTAPNNWASVDGGSAWEPIKDGNNTSYYLHQFKKEQPDLNLRNPSVIDALKDAMKFWLDKGIDGVALEKVQFMLVDEQFRDEPQTSSYNKSLPLKYDMLEHIYTHDLKGNKDIVKNFQELIANYSGAVLMAEVSGSSNQSAQFYEVCDFPYNTALIPTSPAKPLAQSIHDSVTETLKSLPKGKSPNWLTGRQRNSRRDAEIIKATNVLVLTLPGTAGIYYGQEIGLVNPDSPVSPMQWTAGSHAGFTSGTPWKSISANYKDVNVEQEKKGNASTFSLYKQLVDLRATDAFKSSDFKVVHVDEQMLAYTRGDHAYLVAISFSDKLWDGDLEKLSGRGKVVLDTSDKQVGEIVDVNKIKLSPKQALVVELHPEHTVSS